MLMLALWHPDYIKGYSWYNPLPIVYEAMEAALDKLQLLLTCVTHASHFPEDETCVVSLGQQGATK